MNDSAVRALLGGACVAIFVVAWAPSPAATSAPQQTQATAQTLPGGASQIQETYGDWRVLCAQQDNTKTCVFSQQIADKNTRQLVLGVEMKATTGDLANGTLVMPFGLAVDKPVTLQIDDAGAPVTVHFKTCVPMGCLVPLSFDKSAIDALKKGTTLNVKATASDAGQEAAFKLSLKGFGNAFDRVASLSK